MKGFILTIDAIIALLLLVATVAILFSYNLSLKDFGKDIYLTEVSSDTLTVMEKQGLLNNLIILGNDSAILDTLSLTPVSICNDLVVVQLQTNTTVSIVTKPNCANSSTVYSISRRSFISNKTVYIAQMKSWYR